MKKEENQLQQVPKHRSIYRYQLKATNQILKDTRELYRSAFNSTAKTNQLHHPPYQDYDVSIFQQHSPRRAHNSLPSKPAKPKSIKQPTFRDFSRQKNKQKQVFQEFGYIQSSFYKEKQLKSKYKTPIEDQVFDGEDYLNQNYVSYSSDNQNYRSNRNPLHFDRSSQSHNKKSSHHGAKRDLKKQRRGLAQISLKVKNIVARMRKMTYKEVSDQVLRQSENDLPHDPQQREKQTKNIRRRVYDALNVLVSVGILGKEQRQVVHTDKTCVPGKKLSEHWQMINQKTRLLEQKKSQYKKKLANLEVLKKNIEMMEEFHARNRRINQLQDKKEETTQSQMRQQHSSINKWHFPLVFLIPPRKIQSKIKIQLQYLQSKQEYIKKITIDNNDYILTDLDVLKYLNLNKNNVIPQKNDQIIFETINTAKDKMKFEQKQQKNQLNDEIYLSD